MYVWDSNNRHSSVPVELENNMSVTARYVHSLTALGKVHTHRSYDISQPPLLLPLNLLGLSVMPADRLRNSVFDRTEISQLSPVQVGYSPYSPLPGVSNLPFSPMSTHATPGTFHDLLEPSFDDNELCSNLKNMPALPVPRPRKKHFSKVEAVNHILAVLRDARMPPSEFLALILDDSTDDFATYRKTFFTDGNSLRLWGLLDILWKNEKGRRHMKEWMKPCAVDLVYDIIHDEMEDAKPKLSMATHEITPEFVSEWDINGLMEQISLDTTPVWTMVLEVATETKEDIVKMKTSKSRNRRTGRSVISAQVHYLRSYHSCKVQIGLGLMVWSTGASRQLINVLNQACLSMSYTSIFSIIQALAKRSLEDARVLAAGPHGIQYDNYNQSTSIHPEQGPNAPNKVQSGTVGVLFEVLCANTEHMKISSIMDCFMKASPLKISDLRPSLQSMKSYQFQSQVNIVKILIKYVSGFSHLHKHPDLQHQPCRPLPPHHKTKFFPLRVSTIEEASVKGNLLVHDDIYLVQLKRDPADLNDLAIPAIHDQLTNACNRGAQTMCKKDLTPWTRREIFQLGFGVFHLIMNLIWALLHTY